MIWILAGLALGVVVGFYIPFTYPLGLPLYYVAILVFGSRLFDNLSVIRRHIVTKISDKKRGK